MRRTSGKFRGILACEDTTIVVSFFALVAFSVTPINQLVANPLEDRKPTTVKGIQSFADKQRTINLKDLARKEISSRVHRSATKQVHSPRVAPKYLTDQTIKPPKSTPIASTPMLNVLESSSPSPSTSTNFLALLDDNTSTPPDTMGAVGPDHLVTTLNSQVRVQDKNGNNLITMSLFGFWAAIDPDDPPDPFDPRVVYDPFEQRWITVAVTDRDSPFAALLVAVSATNDPTGEWFLYSIDVDDTNVSWGDHPNLGFTKDWIIVSVNMFENNPGIGFSGSNIYAFNKADLYAEGIGLFTLLHDDNGVDMVPTQTYDHTLDTAYLIEDWSGTGAELRMSKINGPVGSEILTVDTSRPTGPFPWDFGNSDNFLPQLGSAEKLDAGDSRIQYCVYRNNSIWCVQTIFLPANDPTRSSIQWWRFNAVGDILQFGQIDDPTGVNFYSYPSIAVNKRDDVLIGYSHASTNQFASASYSFRFGSDPVNTLRKPVSLKSGEATYFKNLGGSRNRWGDYSATVVDPINDISMWTIQEYAALPFSNPVEDRWSTWWGRVDLTTYVSIKDILIKDSLSGNGNGSIDPGETIQLITLLQNTGAEAATNVTATLIAGNAEILMTNPYSEYPDIPVGNLASNLTSFAYRLPRTFPCGETLTFTNVISANGIIVTNTFTQAVGVLQSTSLLTNVIDATDVPIDIVDLNTISSIITNSLLLLPDQEISNVNVSVRLDHTFDEDLLISIEHPDGTKVVLSFRNGEDGENFGSGDCGSGEIRTVFDDTANVSIVSASAPFNGTFKPDQTLSIFNGKPANGEWTINITDGAEGDEGELLCWGLEITTEEVPTHICSPYNSAPIASNQVVNVSGDIINNLLLVGSDPDNDPITFNLVDLPANGILTDLDTLTGNVTYTPAHGYHGTDQFTFVTNDRTNESNTAAIDLTIIQPPDSDSDDIPDYWELLYSGTETNAVPNEDLDGDGKDTLSEYKANTDPNNSSSLLKITSITQDESDHLILNWSTTGGTRYRIEFSDGDMSGNYTNTFTEIAQPLENEFDPSPIGQPSSMSFTDDFTLTPPIPITGNRYYRIQASPE